eukprot:6490476-Amphidinium_carterae.1
MALEVWCQAAAVRPLSHQVPGHTSAKCPRTPRHRSPTQRTVYLFLRSGLLLHCVDSEQLDDLFRGNSSSAHAASAEGDWCEQNPFVHVCGPFAIGVGRSQSPSPSPEVPGSLNLSSELKCLWR